MTLDAARRADLAPADNFSLIDRFLPDPYRRALSREGDPMAALTRAGREALRRSLNELEAVQRSRAVGFFDDLTDGRLLGALHDQAPWPEDDTETFRARLLAVSALAMRGAATAERMLALCALAGTGAAFPRGSIAAPIAPNTDYSFELRSRDAEGNEQVQALSGRTADGQTRQYFQKPATGGLFAVDVFDAPLRRHEAEISPLPGTDFQFVLDNPASETLPGLDGTEPVLWPDPVFTITAGAQPFGPFALVQTGSAQVLVVNRVLDPGATLHVDPRRMAWDHEATGSTSLGRFRCRGEKQALYAGYSLSADDHVFAPPAETTPTGPLLILRGKAGVTYTGALPGGPPVDPARLGAEPLEMPSLLGDGRSQWRVIEIGGSGDDIHAAQFAPVPSDTDVRFKAHWFGRRPGEFAIAIPDSALAPDQGGPLTHRARWLDGMIERFKLAGTVRIAQALLFSEAELIAGRTELFLSDRARPVDALETDLPAFVESVVRPVDTITLLPHVEIEAVSVAVPVDAITFTDADLLLGALVSRVAPVDGIGVAEGLLPEFRSVVSPLDAMTLLPRLEISTIETVRPSTVFALEMTTADLGALRSVAGPVDAMTLLPELRFDLPDSAAPRDRVDVDPGARPEPREPIIDTPTRRRTLSLRSTAQPLDRMTLRRTRR